MTNVLVREGEVEFCKPISRAVLRDARLSFGARGLFCFLWDLPRNWEPNIGHLATMGPEGRDAVRARLLELQRVGGMRIEPIRVAKGQVAGRRWVLVNPQQWAIASPLSSSDDGGARNRARRGSDIPSVGKSDSKVHLEQVSASREAADQSQSSRKGVDSRDKVTPKKRRRKRPTGIITWCSDDEAAAERLELLYPPESVSAAVQAASKAGRQPLPGIVEEYADMLERSGRAAVAAAQMRKQAEDGVAAEISLAREAIQTGNRLLAAIRIKKGGCDADL